MPTSTPVTISRQIATQSAGASAAAFCARKWYYLLSRLLPSGDFNCARRQRRSAECSTRRHRLPGYGDPQRRRIIATISRLDSSTFADNVIFRSTDRLPDAVVVRAAYDTHKGYRVLLTLTRSNGEPVPWRDGKRRYRMRTPPVSSAIKAKVFPSGSPEEGLLLVNWGSAFCRADYRLDISST